MDKVRTENPHDKTEQHQTAPKWPLHGWAGIGLIGIFWLINWGFDGLRTHWAFFPLWLGYCLTIDALIYLRSGRSPISKHQFRFFWLFVLSSPGWWLFEFFNARTHYWEYIPLDSFSQLEYYLYCTLNFTVVMPAVFLTSELVDTWQIFNRLKPGFIIGNRKSSVWIIFMSGWLMLIAMYIWPQYGMAFMWMSLFFILDPINYWMGNKSIISETRKGKWKTILILWVGVLVCGFFWEMWNMYSNPKWIYHVPFVDFLYVFEMPILGYLGYLPFALELYAIYFLVCKFIPQFKFDFEFMQND